MPRHKSLTSQLYRLVGITATGMALAACGSKAATPPTTTRPSTIVTTPAKAAPPSTYPPTTVAGAEALAHDGDPSQVTLVKRYSEGLPSCPEPNENVTVPATLTGRALVATLLAYYFSQSIGGSCGAAIFADHSASEFASGGFTAGSVALDTSGGSGHYNLTVIAGDVTAAPTVSINY